MYVTINHSSKTAPLNEEAFQQLLTSNISPSFLTSEVRVHAFNGRHNRFTGDSDKFSIALFSIPSREATTVAELEIIEDDTSGIAFSEKINLIKRININTEPIADMAIIKDKNGLEIAFYDERTKILYLPFDVYRIKEAMDEQILKDTLEIVFKLFEQQFVEPYARRDSWKFTDDKDGMIKRFTEIAVRNAQREMERNIENLEHDKRRISEYIESMKGVYDNMHRRMRELENAENVIANINGQIIKDLDLISQHDNFEDVRIENNLIVLYTKDIYAYTQANDRYYIGKFRITVNMDNTEVKFFNINNTRRGYWDGENHHPHVDRRGSACFGNVGGSIAMLCSQKQVYALALILIDYLESANIQDPAGARVTAWDKVDEEGNIIQKGWNHREGRPDDNDEDEHTFTCNNCDESYHEDEGNAVYTTHRGGEDVGGEEEWCEGCRENNATYYENIDCVVTYAVAEALDTHFQEVEEA